MIKAIVILLAILLLMGCASKYQELLDKIPYAKFEDFKYSRVTGVSTAKIEAQGVSIDGDRIIIQRVYINETFPGFALDATLEGYERQFPDGKPDKLMDVIRPTGGGDP